MIAWATEVRRDAGVFDDLAPWWNSCSGPASTPFLRTEWFSLWAESFLPASWKLEVVTWMLDGKLRAALPLSSNGVRHGSLSNSHSDVFDLIAADGDASGRASDWLSRRPMTRLYRLDGTSDLVPDHPDPGWRLMQSSEAPFTDLRGGIEGLRATMGRNLNKNITRLERRLGDLGELVYLDNADGELPEAVRRCMELEASGWKGDRGTAMLSRPESRRFYGRLVELARDRGWLRVSALLVAEHLVACQLSLDYNGRRFLLKPAYDEEMSNHSPGRVLQWRVMQSAVALGLESYEFLGEAERWKMEWASAVRNRQSVLRFAKRGPGALVGQTARIASSRRAPGAEPQTEP